MKKLNKLALISILIFVLCNISFSQSDNFINQYDPYVTTPKKLTFYYPVDDDPQSTSSKFAIFIYGTTIGSQKDAFIKIITADKIGFDASKEFQNGYLQEISIMDLRGILVPPIKDMGGSNFLVLNIRLYAGFNETDYAKLKKISDEGTVTINSSIINPFMGFYSFYGSKNEVYKPTDENWAEVQVFLSGMGTRQKVDCGGIELVIPYVTTVTNIKSGDNFVPGDKVFEDKKSNSMAIVNFKLVNNELLVMAQDYYKKLLDRFLKYAGNSIYNDALPGIMEELNDFKSVGFKDKNDVYVSPEAKKQLMYVLDLLILGQPIKADTTVNTSRIPLEGELVLDYFRSNISGDKTKSNRYIFEDFIGNDMNRIKLQRELELVRNYYNIK
jgi:hypothetical protein